MPNLIKESVRGMESLTPEERWSAVWQQVL